MITEKKPVFEAAIPETAFEKYADMVYRLAFVRTKNRTDSDDILQEVFMRYMKIYEKMESEEHIKATLLRITVNCSNSFLTSFWQKKTDALDENLKIEDVHNDTYVLEQVLNLPLKYRTAIHLHYYCGYSVEDISKIEKLNISTVKTHLKRAREILKKTLKEDDL